MAKIELELQCAKGHVIDKL